MTSTGEPNPNWPMGCAVVLSRAGFADRKLFRLPTTRGVYMGESRKTSELHRLIRVRPALRKTVTVYWGGYWKRARA